MYINIYNFPYGGVSEFFRKICTFVKLIAKYDDRVPGHTARMANESA